MKIHTDPQRSEKWFERRLGKPTASQFGRIIYASGKPSSAAHTYMHELAYEAVTGKLFERKGAAAVPHVQHGILNEPVAVEAFEQHTGLRTGPVGFITDDAESIGCTPDRIILGANEALEVKCPQGHTQCGYLMHGLEGAYYPQIQGQMLIGRFSLVHFFAWNPELPPYYLRVEPDLSFMAKLEKCLDGFIAELARGVAHIKAIGTWPSNAPSIFPEDDSPDAA